MIIIYLQVIIIATGILIISWLKARRAKHPYKLKRGKYEKNHKSTRPVR